MSNDEILDSLTGTEIAVVGMACRFPGATTADQYWQNVRDGVESVRTYTDDELREAGVDEALLRNPNYVKVGAPIDTMEQFDAGFFGFSPREAAIMDPQHRHFLECSWEAMEHAGYDPQRFDGAVGVFGGSGHNAYLPYNILTNPELLQSEGFFLLRHTGNDKDFLTTRVSYLFDLKGPSINVQTACSTSLVAIHLAGQSLLSMECDMALAGGVTLEMPHRHGYLYEEGEILSPDGHCRAFDAESKGTVFGSGAGVVVLRRLEDAIQDGDTIHAIILGSAINNDGLEKASYLAPSVDGQAGAIGEALSLAGIDADTVTYVETHGTGTPIGDPIEVNALTQAFRATTDATQYCGVGSAKTNIGHLDTAAGVAAFIKAVQAIKHAQLPPSLNFTSPNPLIDWERSPFYVNHKLQDWDTPDFPRRAGVSSLGVGGTNAHIIIEEPPILDPSDNPTRDWHVMALSAKSKSSLDGNSKQLAAYLNENPHANLADVAYTLQNGRQAFRHRRVVAGRTAAEIADALANNDKRQVATRDAGDEASEVVFMFPGGGAQYPNMGRELYESEPVYREQIDLCLRLLESQLDEDLRSLMFPPAEQLDEAAIALQRPSLSLPSIFMTEYALAQLWMSWGIEPVAMTGHSMGEYTAACLAGVLSVEDALAIVTLRGKLFETLPEGAMISVPLPEAEVEPMLVDGASIAVINSPSMCVVSGEVSSIEEMEKVLDGQEIEYRRVKIKVAAHSPMLEPILEEFGNRLQQIRFSPPQMPYISNVTGTWVRPEDAMDPQYWVRHLRHTVRFADGLTELLKEHNRVLLEVGPGQTLMSLVRQHPSKHKSHTPLGSLRHRRETISDVQFFYTAFGQIWGAGAEIDWSILYDENEVRHRIPLPTYAFDHQRYWIDPGNELFKSPHSAGGALVKLDNLDDWFYAPSWKHDPLPRRLAREEATRWLVFDDEVGLGAKLIDILNERGHTVVTVSAADRFETLSQHEYVIRPSNKGDYERLFESLGQREMLPERIVHLWSVNHNRDRNRTRIYERAQSHGFFSLMYIAQVLGDYDIEDLALSVVTNGTQRVASEQLPYPEKATLYGPVKVINREFPNVFSQAIDIELPVSQPRFFGLLGDEIEVDWETQAKPIARELLASTTDQVVALRDSGRWVHEYSAVPTSDEDKIHELLKQRGVYLITGGLGGIGLTLSEYLARNYRARLVLIGRSGLPERDKWPAWLDSHADTNRTSRRIQKIMELESLGAEVLPMAADVTDAAQLAKVIEQTQYRFGKIDGVIHAAGLISDELIQLKESADVVKVMGPKVLGTLALDSAFRDTKLDFMMLFSSTSTVLGPVGQIDYVGANAFLNAFAESKTASGGTHTVALNWGVWSEVGMAAAAARGEVDEFDGESVSYPLFDMQMTNTESKISYITKYTVDDYWILDQHRIKHGEALIPGTGYLEIGRAAINVAQGQALAGSVEINDLFFLTPLEVKADEAKYVQVELEQSGNGYNMVISSQIGGGGKPIWQEHARARVSALGPEGAGAPSIQSIPAIIGRCNQWQESYGYMEQETRQEVFLDFGPRWKNLRRVHYGTDESIAYLELPSQFEGDLTEFKLHPALMDLATSAGLPLIDGYAERDDFYVPLSYQSLCFYRPLPAKIYSHVRYHRDAAGSQEVPTFDIMIMDELGTPLVQISKFTVKRVSHADMIAQQSRSQNARSGQESEAGSRLLQLALGDGILPEEGMNAFERVLAADLPPQVIVTSVALNALMEQIDSETEEKDGGGLSMSRPELDSEYAEPTNEIERTLVKYWEDLLGVSPIGINDDFFELGGHSLIAVRLFTRIKKKYAVDFSLATLFDAPTIAACTKLMVAELGEDILGSEESVESGESSGGSSAVWSPLVLIEKGNADKLPFFCVHGAGGNVLNFRDLSKHLGKDQPFYGVQAQGVDGKQSPLTTIDEMADLYLAAIREVQPHGPYYFGGYSGGGVVAYEMAQRLVAEGEEIALLAFLDTFHPHIRPQSKSLSQHLSSLPKAGINTIIKRLRKRSAKRSTARQREMLLQELQTTGQEIPMELREWHLTTSFLNAGYQYDPKPYHGAVIQFSATDTWSAYDHVGADRGWEPLVGEFSLRMVPGDHDSIVLEPNIQILTSHLKAALQSAQAQFGPSKERVA